MQVTIRNTSPTNADRNVRLRILFPPNVTPDPQGVRGPTTLPQPTLQGGALVFEPLVSLAPGEVAQYFIPINPLESGIVQITAQAMSANAPQAVSHQINLEIRSDRR
jgi:hypothetical protein